MSTHFVGSFFFLGGLVVLTDGPCANATDVDFHNGIAIDGVPGKYPVSDLGRPARSEMQTRSETWGIPQNFLHKPETAP